MKILNYEIFKIHAGFCKTLANPTRLIIVTALEKRDMTVGELSELVELPIANISQHLKLLRDKDIVTFRKDGQKVYYSLSDPRLIEACDKIRSIIIDLYKKRGKIITGEIKKDDLISD